MIIIKHIWQIIHYRFNWKIKHKRIEGGKKMKNLFVSVLAKTGEAVADMGSSACMIYWLDEPKMPENLIK